MKNKYKLDYNKFFKVKEIILYIFAVFFFWNFDIIKNITMIMILMTIIDIFIYRKKIECIDSKTKYIILSFIIIGIGWNYFADFNYKAARAFFKINRFFILVFYIAMLYDQKKEVLRNFMCCLLFSYIGFLLKTTIYIYDDKFVFTSYNRLNTFLGSILETALMTTLVSCFLIGDLFYKITLKRKIFELLLIFLSLGAMLLTSTRAAFLSVLASIFVMGMVGIIYMKKQKILLFLGGIIFIIIMLGVRSEYFPRIKRNIFNTKVTSDNMSNGLRVLMWKNAIWRIKHHPILGSGIKNDDNLFKEFVIQLPENTKVEKEYKEELKNFNDAHSMYLNGFADSGIFYFFNLFLILVLAPYKLLKNIKSQYSISLLGCLVAFSVFGIPWSIWRSGWSCVAIWLLISLSLLKKDTKKNE